MNVYKYAENPNMARNIVFMEDFELIKGYLEFYQESEGFTKYYQDDLATIRKTGRRRWQRIMNSVNSNAVYYGDFNYTKILEYLNILKKLIINEEKKKISMIKEWNETYPELMSAYQKLEQISSEESFGEAFMDYFNELRIAANKEFLKLM